MADNLLFIDTSAFYAFFDRKDINHNKIVNIFQSRSEKYITSNQVKIQCSKTTHKLSIVVNDYCD